MGIFRLLMESIKTLKSNRNLLLPVLVTVYLIQPVVKDCSLHLIQLFQNLGNNNMHHQTGKYDQNTPINIMLNIGDVLLVNIFILNFCLTPQLMFLDTTASNSISTTTFINLKEMMLKIDKSRNKLVLVSFHLFLLTMGPIFVWFCYIYITSVLSANDNNNSCTFVMIHGVLLLVVLLSIASYEFYVSALGVMSLVVLALEDVSGLNAIVRAREVMKGKNLQACVMMVIFAIAYGLIDLTTNGIASCDIQKWSRLDFLIRLSNGLLSVLKLFVFVIFTAFYFERKLERCDDKQAKIKSF